MYNKEVFTFTFHKMNPEDTTPSVAVENTAPTAQVDARSDDDKELQKLRSQNGRMSKKLLELEQLLEARDADLTDYKTRYAAIKEENDSFLSIKKQLENEKQAKIDELKKQVSIDIAKSVEDLPLDKQLAILSSVPKSITPATPAVTQSKQPVITPTEIFRRAYGKK